MKTLKLISLLILVALQPQHLEGQSKFDSTRVSGLIRKLVQQLQTDSFFFTNGTCKQLGKETHIKTLFEFINLSKDFECLELTKHPNPTIRCFSFQTLLGMKYPEIVDILEAHLLDTAQVSVIAGCSIASHNVIQVFVKAMSRGRESPEFWLDEKAIKKLIAIKRSIESQ